jgi:hypothetical protein
MMNTLSEAFWKSFYFFVPWFIVTYTYWGGRVLLSLWIEDNEKAKTYWGIGLSILFCVVAAFIIEVWFHNWANPHPNEITAFIVVLVCGLVAAYKEYNKKPEY